ncbi:uncharacterized protein LOC129789090 [Lutzomyia longipalpis]|uniref:uncharacterized protein LOC129789090 n=1 Tax=Lutzomyia longipalpis TaxID=7200 RepID=UPI00248366D2|nr:uncharacterized protein LOC129789090 [Lutzomyia longipalpis]
MKSSLCEDKEEIFYISSLVVLIVGGALNIAVLLGIVRRIKVSGVFCFILQIMLCDMISLWIFPLKQWILADFCALTIGVEILLGTAVTYLVIAVNFHAVSLHNLAVCQQRRHENLAAVRAQDECNNEESAGNETKERRTLTIDYNRMKRSISAILPTASIWLLATSIALPHVVSLHTSESTSNSCCSLGVHIPHLKPMIFIVVIVLQIALPTLFGICGIFFVSSKLTAFQLDLTVCKLAENVKEILIFSLILTTTFILVSLHSNTLRFLGILPQSTYSKLLSIAHSFMPAIRPIIYLTTLKHLRRSIMMFFTP